MAQILMKPSAAIERFRQRVMAAWLVRRNGQSLLESVSHLTQSHKGLCRVMVSLDYLAELFARYLTCSC